MRSIQRAAAAIGHEPTERELATTMAKRLPPSLEGRCAVDGYRVLDGVRELLPRLGDAGCLLGADDRGEVEAAAHIKPARANLNHYFSFGGYGSDSSDRAELTRCAITRAGRILGRPLDPWRALVVGDTPTDVDAAHAAGAVAVGVASGRFSASQLAEAGADDALRSLREERPGVGERVG